MVLQFDDRVLLVEDGVLKSHWRGRNDRTGQGSQWVGVADIAHIYTSLNDAMAAEHPCICWMIKLRLTRATAT